MTAPPKDHTVGPLTLRLVAALNYGTATAVVVQLVAQGDHQVDVAAGTLRVGSTAAQTTAHVLVGGQPGYVLDSFPRNDAKPTDWTATVTVDNAKAQQVVLAF